MKKILLSILLPAVIGFTFLAACGETNDVAGDTVTEGKLTVATGEPAWEPWMMDNDPTNGEGYESAVVYMVAEELGFKKEDVVWVRTTFDQALQPGAKDYDFNIQQFTITPEREKSFAFSLPYYSAPYAVIVDKNGKYKNAKTIKELKSAVFGVPQGDVALDITKEEIAPDSDVKVFNNLSDCFSAFKTGQIDAIIQGVTTADYNVNIDNKQIPNSKILGLLSAKAESFGFLFEKTVSKSFLEKINIAIEKLEKEGKFNELNQKYLAGYNYPVLK